MDDAHVIDARDYDDHTRTRLAPIYWGIWGLIVIEGMVFASLVGSYFYLRLHATSWPPPGVEPPKLLMPSINTAILLASMFFVHKADKSVREHGHHPWLTWGLGIGALLAATFLGLKYAEYSGLSYRWNSHAYGSIVWTITGFHSAHVMFLLMKTLVVELLAFKRHFDQESNVTVQVNGLYWNFVVLVWLPLYAVLYFTPYVL